MRKKAANRRNNRRGATMIEGAIVLSVTFLLIFAGLDLSIAVTRYNALGECARRAARQAAVLGENASALGSCGPTNMSFTANQSNRIADAIRHTLPTMLPQDVTVLVEWPDGTNCVNNRVRVTLSYKHYSAVPLFTNFSQLNLQAVSTMQVGH